jgi:hypothetical protein
MNRLKQITTKAKQLYKTGKYAKWTDAIKAASKKTATVGATKKKSEKKKSAPKKNTAVKKAALKKKASVRNYGSHKDTASHNVKISVVSGTTKSSFNMLKVWENVYGKLAQDYISSSNTKEKQKIKKEMTTVKLIISDIKKIKTF